MCAALDANTAAPDRWPAAGVYQLHLRVPAARRLRVGALGWCEFPPGSYIYTGRAARGLAGRLRRYVRIAGRGATRAGARLHWHIDYLLNAPGVALARISLASTAPADECRGAAAVRGEIPCPGFGASDCCAGCPAHLVLVTRDASRGRAAPRRAGSRARSPAAPPRTRATRPAGSS